MNFSQWIRQVHRWLAILFTLTVVANFVAIAAQGTPPPWITYSPLLPLFLLMFTGLYMFAVPYVREAAAVMSDSAEIDAKIAGLGDWRGETLARVRKLIREADPDVVEELKWRKPSNPAGVPTWSHGGIMCTGETYKERSS